VFQVEIKYSIQKIEKLDYLYYNIEMINSGRIQKENFHYFTKAASKLTEGEIEAISELFSNNYGCLKPISKKDFDNFIEYSEQRLIDAYSRMDMQNQSWAKHTAAEINFIKQYMPNTKELQIVDIGCGTARHIAELFANGYKNVYGFDFSQNLIHQALNSHPELENKVFTKDVRNLKLSKKADVILCLYDVIGSFPTSSENLKIIKAAKRNLKKGGLFICSVMNMELTESLCKYKFDIYNNPKELFKLKASQTMQQTGNIFNPDNFIIDTNSNLVYRKEMFKGDGFLDSEYIIRDKRYTKNEISDLLETSGFSIVDSRYVRAGKFEEALNATDKNAKEILIIARLN
jgi:SAM-dependent methyltransferase